MTKAARTKDFLRRHVVETTVGNVDVQAGKFELHVTPDGDFTAKLDGKELEDVDELTLHWETGNLFNIRVGYIVDPRIKPAEEIVRT